MKQVCAIDVMSEQNNNKLSERLNFEEQRVQVGHTKGRGNFNCIKGQKFDFTNSSVSFQD